MLYAVGKLVSCKETEILTSLDFGAYACSYRFVSDFSHAYTNIKIESGGYGKVGW